MSENRITLGIKIPLGKASSHSSIPIRVQNYSYFASDEVGLGYISHVYLGKNDLNSTFFPIQMR